MYPVMARQDKDKGEASEKERCPAFSVELD
jgi:hypothetical protein